MVPIHPCVNRAKMLFSYIVVPYEGWNRTEFWTQNSRLYLDFIPKQKFLFSDSRLSNRWLYAINIRARLNKIWPKRKKNSVLVVALKKKNSRFLVIFSRLFPGLESCWANFKTFSRIQDSVRTLNLGREKIDHGKRGSSLPLLTTIFPHKPLSQCHFVYSQAIPRFLDHLRTGWLPLEIGDLRRENRTEI